MEIGMKRALRMVLVLALMVVFAEAQEKFEVKGFGGVPLSSKMTSMWLSGSDHHPLLMAYFCGPDGWHNTQWKATASKFEQRKLAWVELKSDKATLRLSIDPDTGEMEVQSQRFLLRESNTFLVLHTGDAPTVQRIVPLGTFSLPASTDRPASALLLQANPGLIARIDQEVAAANHQA
jgi:hypothetical protein